MKKVRHALHDKRGKLFIENILVYGMGSAISKIVPYLLLPLIATLMPGTVYMAISDTANVLVIFGTQIGIMGIYDAMYRVYFDEEEETHKRNVTASSLVIVSISASILLLVLICSRQFVSKILFESEQYGGLVILCGLNIISAAILVIISAPTRMLNQKKRYVLINTITSIISSLISIALLLLKQYAIALPMAATLTSMLSCLIFWHYNKAYFYIRSYTPDMVKQLLKLAIPLMPAFIFYWILSSLDRIMITNISGLSTTGIYSFGAKLAQISQFVYLAFSGGYQYFVFSTMKDEDHVTLISSIFDYLAGISFFITVCIMLLSRPAFSIIAPMEYFEAWTVFPLLFLCPLLLMLFQVLCNQLMIIKKAWYATAVLFVSSLLTITLHLVLIGNIGLVGAAVANIIGYSVSLIPVLIIVVFKRILFLRLRIVIGYGLTIAAGALFLLDRAGVIFTVCAVVSCMMFIAMYWKDIGNILQGIKKRIKYKG